MTAFGTIADAPAPDRHRLATAALLVLVVGTAYANALGAAFQFDDYGVIVDNPDVQSLGAWWRSMPGIRPLSKLSTALTLSLAPGAAAFHAINIALHLVNVLLVWALSRRWLRRLSPTSPPIAAAATALLFGLHPATTEAVTYASGRSVSLMAMCYLLSLLAFGWGDWRRCRWPTTVLSPLLFAAALGVRETAATLPLALLLTAWLARDDLRTVLRALRSHAVVLLAAVAAALLMPGYERFFSTSIGIRPLGDQVRAQLVAHAHLFVDGVVGLQTNIDPDLRVPTAMSPELLATAIALLFAAWLAWRQRRAMPWLSFGIAWYFLQLAPGNSLLPRFDLANDRHLYLALPGVALVVAVGTSRWHATWERGGVIALLAIALGHATVLRNRDYRDETTLWRATVRASPSKPRAWVNLGVARRLAGDTDQSRAAFECALAIDPWHARAMTNLAALPPGRTEPAPGCPAY